MTDALANLSLRLLRYVVGAAEFGSLSEAAARLHVSQASISAAVAQLEGELGVALFVRHHARGVTLTPAGRHVVAEARALLAHAQDFAQGARALGGAPRGEIAVGCFMTLAMRYMPSLLAAFRRHHPGIAVRLEEGDQAEILEGLRSGRTEFALSYGFAVPDGLRAETLAELPPYAMVAASHALAARPRIALAALAAEPFLLLDLPHSRDYFAGLFAAAGLQPRTVFRSRSYELIRGMVGHGHGYTVHNVIPRTDIAYDGSRVAMLRLEGRLAPVQVTALRPQRQPSRPAVETFAAFLRAAFAPGGMLTPRDR